MAKEEQCEYYIGRLGPITFQVTKFRDGDETPAAVYNVQWDETTGKGKCDCPAGTYRGTGPNDKHVKMVRNWVETVEKAGLKNQINFDKQAK